MAKSCFWIAMLPESVNQLHKKDVCEGQAGISGPHFPLLYRAIVTHCQD